MHEPPRPAPLTQTLRVHAADGAAADLYLLRPRGQVAAAALWLPALGVAARNYLPLAEALAAHGVAVALHEWRGHGSSNRRAGYACDWGYRELLEQDLPASRAALQAACPDARLWIGGHSLGGQLAMLFAARQAEAPAGLWLVGSGAPYWRAFPRPWLIGAAVVLAPFLATVCGRFPGRRLGFGGHEARGVMTDWARSGRSGRYAPAGMAADLEAECARLRLPVLALRLRDDWLGPAGSLDWLLGKMPQARKEIVLITPDDLGGLPADHFAWMKAQQAIAARLAGGVGTAAAGR